ncbi:allophanate hydrolase [Pseudomonas neustonica]|uniref:Allophanate hydrolase n=1 Tax=Pseudomonas neustonica TaxID=2487346 RepID=A0ABX9XL43_9PSED|nr:MULTISPECIES: allophanate hydrolase [Pseudomonas]ROZ85572.1 allophanate hydrolase [Pseudomonas sp. SSM44]ROZ87534.1 allophanate hydrolase [Pseudomonas neustonica]
MKIDMSISGLKQAYLEGSLTPAKLLASIREQAVTLSDHNIWIYLLTETEHQPYLDALATKDPATTPLWGVPFAIKDNIDLAGVATTNGCDAFAYTPAESSQVVQQLIDAGAIPIGKTNLDQFATGLNGTRSPHGPCHNAFDFDYISGGSSAGSSVSVAKGLATFSLGTDTAGSGRVPACFNNLVGLKPTRGLLSASGLVPACRSLDCISIFALNSDDANSVLACAEGFDSRDGYSRANPFNNQNRQYGRRGGALKIGVLTEEHLQFFGDQAYAATYAATLEKLAATGIELVTIDYTPFNEAALLLYEGPWVTERYLAAQPLIDDNPEAIFPVVREIIAPGGKPPATALFKAQYRLEELKKACHDQLKGLDCLLTPTAGRLFTIAEMLEEPILRNSQLGYYTNYMNLVDMTSVAVPTAFTEAGLPFGITLVGPAFSDRALLSIANRIQQTLPLPQGALDLPQPALSGQAVGNPDSIDVLVCGAHLEGLPLNWQLIERGAVLKQHTQTSAHYLMYALAGGPPFRPGLIRDEAAGVAIEVEIWSMPKSEFGSFVAGIPAPLGIGKVQIADGSWVCGFICEPYGLEGSSDISALGGWRAYMAQR